MRLLKRDNTGEFSLTRDLVEDDKIPRMLYFRTQDSEEDTMDGTGTSKPGYYKIQFCREQALEPDTMACNTFGLTPADESNNTALGGYQLQVSLLRVSHRRLEACLGC
jgi:hypothetical protein